MESGRRAISHQRTLCPFENSPTVCAFCGHFGHYQSARSHLVGNRRIRGLGQWVLGDRPIRVKGDRPGRPGQFRPYYLVGHQRFWFFYTDSHTHRPNTGYFYLPSPHRFGTDRRETGVQSRVRQTQTYGERFYRRRYPKLDAVVGPISEYRHRAFDQFGPRPLFPIQH